MSEAYRDIKRMIELDAPLMTEYIGKMVQSDAQAHRFILTLMDEGKVASLAGYSVSGKFVNAYGEGISIKGAISGNVVTAVLDEACYHVPGMAGGFIRVQNADASIIRTVMRFTADVESDGGDAAYDPNGAIGSLDELLAKIAAMEAATADGLAAAQEARDAGAQAIADAQAAGAQAKATAQTAADDATAAAETARSTIYTRAVAIPDTSALAASHELYAQRDHPLNVRAHSHTYQEGKGDPSPENVRLIHGLDAAHMRAGGKNLFDLATWMSMTSTLKGVFYVSDAPVLAAGEYIWICTEYSQVDDLQYTLALVNESGGAFNLIWDGSVKEQTLIKSDTPLCWRLNWNPNTFPNKVAAITAQLESGSVGTPYEPYIANTADLPLLPDGAPLMEGDTVENWGKSGCDARKVISSADDLTLENFDASVNVVYSDTAASIAVTDGVITSALTYPTTVYYRSTDYTPDKDLRVCRVTRKMYTMTLDGSENWGTDQAYLVTNITKAAANRYAGAKQYANMYRADSGIAQEGGIAVSDKVYVKDSNFTTGTEFKNALVERAAAGNPLVVSYELATPEVYMTDPLPLLPPAALESDTVTVTGSGKTEVEYAHETKHFIIDFVTKALASQS